MYLGLYLLLGLIFTLIVYYIESPKDFKQFMADVWTITFISCVYPFLILRTVVSKFMDQITFKK